MVVLALLFYMTFLQVAYDMKKNIINVATCNFCPVTCTKRKQYPQRNSKGIVCYTDSE